MFRNESISRRISEIIGQGLNLQIQDDNANLFETGGLDSLMFVELLVLLEHEFAVRISVDDLELDDFSSIAQIARLIERMRYTAPEEADECTQITPLPRPA